MLKKKILMLFLMSVLFSISATEVFANDKVYKSDIAVLIDDIPVESEIINDEVYIDIESLGAFGFEVIKNDAAYTLVSDGTKYRLNFLPIESINILKDDIDIEEVGEAEQSGLYFQDGSGNKYDLYDLDETYLIRLRDLDGTYGSLDWDAENRRAYFNITEFSFANDYESGLADFSISDDERLMLVTKNNEIEVVTYRGQVEDFKVNGIGIIQAEYKNGERIITKGNFPDGYAEGRLISYKYSSDKLLNKVYAGVYDSKLNGAYIYVEYSGNYRIEGNYEMGTPIGEQRKCILDNEYLYGYKVIDNDSDNLRIYDKPFEKLNSIFEISEDEYDSYNIK